MKQMEELIQINGILEFDKLKVSYTDLCYILMITITVMKL